MEKNVALDPHGNPLPDEDEVSIGGGDVALEGGDYDERQRLTADVDDVPEDDVQGDREPASSHQV